MSKQFTIIKLDKERKLRFANKSIIFFEEATGKDFLGEFNKICEGEMNIKMINHMLHAGLHAFDKDLTFDEALDLADESTFTDIMEALTNAIGESYFLTQTANSQKVMEEAPKEEK